MPTYSPLQILYLAFQFLSIFLTIFLIVILLGSKKNFIKRTLFHICISVLGYSSCAIPSLLAHGDKIQSEAFVTPLCIIQYRFALFFFYPLIMFPAVLSYYLWLLVCKSNKNPEQDTLRWFSVGIWGSSLVYSIVVLFITRKERHMGVMVTWLYCESANLKGKWYIYYVYLMIFFGMFLINLFLGGRSTYILYNRWNCFKNNPNRVTAANLGYAVRAATYINLLLALMLTYFLSSVFTPKANNKNEPWTDNTFYIGDFTSALSGTLLFSVFGTTRTATLFLPCCYYPPELPVHSSSYNRNEVDLKKLNNDELDKLKKVNNDESREDNDEDKKAWLEQPNTGNVKVESNNDHSDENYKNVGGSEETV